MIIHTDCRHFMGDRPCRPHKFEGVKCGDCHHYDQVGAKILIIKLDAAGDVLRTTCVLDALHEAHPGCRIEWLTRESAAELLANNPLISRVHCYPGNAELELSTRWFDFVINLDSAWLSSQLAMIARGHVKLGFVAHPDGYVEPLGDAARKWFEMGLFDDVKRRNARTYQEIALDICGLPTHRRKLHLYLSDEEWAWAQSQATAWGVSPAHPVVGLNTGCGARWPHKKWTEDGYVALVELLNGAGQRLGRIPQILLLGGPEERERNARIAANCGPSVIDAGCDHTLRRFCAVLNLCDVVVTGDTLGLHAAAALEKRSHCSDRLPPPRSISMAAASNSSPTRLAWAVTGRSAMFNPRAWREFPPRRCSTPSRRCSNSSNPRQVSRQPMRWKPVRMNNTCGP